MSYAILVEEAAPASKKRDIVRHFWTSPSELAARQGFTDTPENGSAARLHTLSGRATGQDGRRGGACRGWGRALLFSHARQVVREVVAVAGGAVQGRAAREA